MGGTCFTKGNQWTMDKDGFTQAEMKGGLSTEPVILVNYCMPSYEHPGHFHMHMGQVTIALRS